MKRGDLLRELARAGCVLKRHGGSHDIYWNPATGARAPVPRHQEIKNTLCDLIRRQLGLP
ncbi:MAG TPA: type II toxin-antitoxin system HicA family toxin [Thermoanaerobaculia bacterium]|nr:type II toxin-antitoxin system HicA family toxin [Thermoanaerobaculia bacterium]